MPICRHPALLRQVTLLLFCWNGSKHPARSSRCWATTILKSSRCWATTILKSLAGRYHRPAAALLLVGCSCGGRRTTTSWPTTCRSPAGQCSTFGRATGPCKILRPQLPGRLLGLP
eukprot:s5555_g3.t1